MADPTSTIPDVIKALRDGLRAWVPLASVTITAAPIPVDRLQPRTIRLIKPRPGADQGPNTVGGRTKREEYAILGRAWFISTDKQGDAAIDDARAAVYAWYGEIERFLWADPHVGSRVLEAIPALVDESPDIYDEGIGVVIDFEVRVKNELRRGG
jgi:hypothetical protein